MRFGATSAKYLLPRRLRHVIERRINSGHFADGYLTEKDWFVGARSHASVANGNPVPWITYPAFEMLDRVLSPSWKLFEYGTGNSSLWYASKVAKVIAVEHDQEWARQISDQAPANLTVVLIERTEADDHGFGMGDFEAYANVPARFGRGYFEVFVIDGMAREACAMTAADLIANGGFIIFDNAERWQYNDAFAALGEKGWKRIDFYGPGPIQAYEWCTSIFCRDLDWLPDDLTIPECRRYPLR